MTWHMHLQQLRRHGDIIKRTVGGYFVVQGRADDTMNLGGIKVQHSLWTGLSFSFVPPNRLLAWHASWLLNDLHLYPLCFLWNAWTNFWILKSWVFLDIQTSSVEIERVCDRAEESIMETAAISVAPVDGGPELLVIFVVLKKGFDGEPDKLKMKFSKAIQNNLNPLFKVWLWIYVFFIHMTSGLDTLAPGLLYTVVLKFKPCYCLGS